MPCFANTYFVKPEQSKPDSGVLPPHVYGVPTYLSAVLRTRDAVAVAAGDLGMRAPDGRVDVPPRDPIASPARITAERTVDGDAVSVPCAHAATRSTQHARTPYRRTTREVMPR